MENNLFNLIVEGRLVLDDILKNNGEITPEIEQKLISNETLVADKVDRIVFFLEALEKEHEYFTRKSQELQRMSQRLRASEAKFKDYLKTCLNTAETHAVYGLAHKISAYKANTYVEILDEHEIPSKFIKIIQTYEIDKQKIREALLEGKDVPGACLKDSIALRISLNSRDRDKK